MVAMGNLLLADQTLGFCFVADGRCHLGCIIAVTIMTFQAQPMESSPTAASTVIATDPDSPRPPCSGTRVTVTALTSNELRQESLQILIILRHWLCCNFVVQFPPLQLHVDGTLTTHWTLIRHCHQVLVAFAVHVVAARHAYDFRSGGKHLIQTERTRSFRCSLDAGVSC